MLIALSSVGGSGNPPRQETKAACESLVFEATTLSELVERYGPPCSVQVGWEDYSSLGSAQPRNLTLLYAYCSVPCGPLEIHGVQIIGGMCHTVSFPALTGPLGMATRAEYVIRDGVLSHAWWEYWQEKAVSAKAELMKIPGVEVFSRTGTPISGGWHSSRCELSATEEPERQLRVMAYKRNP
jgi:hypothetical protein